MTVRRPVRLRSWVVPPLPEAGQAKRRLTSDTLITPVLEV